MQITAIFLKKLFVSSLLLSFSILPEDADILGKWKSQPSGQGNITLVHFKSDNHFDGFINKKPFVTGTYQFHASELYFIDNGCEGKTGRYKTIFFSHNDSLRFELISDSCNERKEGMLRLVMGRIKNEGA